LASTSPFLKGVMRAVIEPWKGGMGTRVLLLIEGISLWAQKMTASNRVLGFGWQDQRPRQGLQDFALFRQQSAHILLGRSRRSALLKRIFS
jgi:hypothetical protein